MKQITVLVILIFAMTLLTAPVQAAGQSDFSFMSVSAPAKCGKDHPGVVTGQQLLQLFGSTGTLSGYSCIKTLLFPQFAVGNGWTSQVTNLMPVQPPLAGLVSGTNPGYAVVLTAGSAATANPNNGATVLLNAGANGCLGFWDSLSATAFQLGYSVIDSGGATRGNLTGLGTLGKCAGGADTQVAGGAQGPLQVQVLAPSEAALNQSVNQLTYFYDGGTFTWQVTVNPIDISNAKTIWTAPLYQGGDYATAFSVVNASNTPQSVNIVLRDDNGNPIGTAKSTPMLAPGCGCSQLGQSAAGGFYAITVADLFGNIGTQTGSIEFTGSSNIVVLVLRTIKTSLGSVPAKN